MKIAVISDIHGNMPALKAVTTDLETWQPDKVVVNGDIVNRGPLSKECLHFVLSKQQTDGWQLLRGNHEDYIIACAAPDTPQSGPQFELMRFAHWAYQQLNGEVTLLNQLPEQFQWFAPDGSEFRVVHASMRGNRDGLYHNAKDDELRQQIDPPPTVFVTGHTHRPFIRHLDDTIIVNAGSVGAPFDKDKRPSYGRFTWTAEKGWQATITRVTYDHQLVENDYVNSGFLSEAGPLAQLMLIELRKARGLIYRWASQYQDAVLNEEITIEDSVRELLTAEDVRPFLGPPGWTINNEP